MWRVANLAVIMITWRVAEGRDGAHRVFTFVLLHNINLHHSLTFTLIA